MDALEQGRKALEEYEAEWQATMAHAEYEGPSLGQLAGRAHTYALFAQAEQLGRIAGALKKVHDYNKPIDPCVKPTDPPLWWHGNRYE